MSLLSRPGRRRPSTSSTVQVEAASRLQLSIKAQRYWLDRQVPGAAP